MQGRSIKRLPCDSSVELLWNGRNYRVSLRSRRIVQLQVPKAAGRWITVCDQAITGGETEYEVAGPVMIVRVHVACYHARSGERREPEGGSL